MKDWESICINVYKYIFSVICYREVCTTVALAYQPRITGQNVHTYFYLNVVTHLTQMQGWVSTGLKGISTLPLGWLKKTFFSNT